MAQEFWELNSTNHKRAIGVKLAVHGPDVSHADHTHPSSMKMKNVAIYHMMSPVTGDSFKYPSLDLSGLGIGGTMRIVLRNMLSMEEGLHAQQKEGFSSDLFRRTSISSDHLALPTLPCPFPQFAMHQLFYSLGLQQKELDPDQLNVDSGFHPPKVGKKRSQIRYKDPESRKETTKALTETIQAKLEVAHAKIEAAEAKKETLEAQKIAEEAKESAEAAHAREDNLLSYVSKVASLAYQQAAEAEYDCAQARKAMAVAEAIQVAAFTDGKVRRNNKEKYHRSHRSHGECRCHHHHHHHHGQHERRSDFETQSDLIHSEPETLSSTR
ncbi:tolA, partial [Ophiophagus hannah]